jgi:hypothetical protein
LEMPSIEASSVYFIKLGEKGKWEEECIDNGILRFGYNETSHEMCLNGDWDGVRKYWAERRGNGNAATNDTRQIRTYYESGESTVFITFHAGLMYWCQPTGPALLQDNGEKIRSTLHGWSSKSIGGAPLTVDRLSGNLLKVQMYRGTICEVKAATYLLQKLNDEVLPQVAAADEAISSLQKAIVGLMRLLTWQDFELLVDLVFSSSGWRRRGVLGSTQKTVDLELLLPTTGERAFVQIKSQASKKHILDYLNRFSATQYDRMFFVWHSGNVGDVEDADGVTFLGPEQLAKMVLDTGLSSWLRDKAS